MDLEDEDEEVYYDDLGVAFDSKEEYEHFINTACNSRIHCGNCKHCVDW